MFVLRLATCTLIATIVGCQTPLLVQRADSLSMILDDTDEAETPQKSVDVNPQAIALLYAVASAAENRGDIQVAIENYEKLLKADPEHSRAMRRLALIHGKRGASTKSTELFKAAIQFEPRNAELQCDYGYALYLAEDFSEAERQIRTSIAMEPELKRARNILGMILARGGEIESALSEFATAKVPRSEAYANIALAMLLNGDTESAKEHILLAESMKPSAELKTRLAEYRISMQSLHTENRYESQQASIN